MKRMGGSVSAFGWWVHLVLFVALGAASAAAAPGASSPRSQPAKPPKTCYEALYHLQFLQAFQPDEPLHITVAGTRMPIGRAMEKEGLLYGDIATLFDRVDYASASLALRERFEREIQSTHPGLLRRWLRDYADSYRARNSGMTPSKWRALDEREQLEWLLSHDDIFSVINIKGREALFYDGLLGFDYLRPAAETPAFLTVGDDMGSYEVRSTGAESDLNAFEKQRALIETLLEGRIGHQHFIHTWPKSAAVRLRMAPYYIELLDSGAWYLFWRQMMRSPNQADSILTHPYLGIYSTNALEKLFRSVVDGDAAGFNNKYRMIGARSFEARPDLPDQRGLDRIVDWEMRSGNKGIKRDFMEDVILARLWTGDYSGLRDFRGYRPDFEPSAPLETLLAPWLDASQVAKVKEFEELFPPLKYSPHARAYNHIRNKVVAPLYNWPARLPLVHKVEPLQRAQQRFAEGLLEIATQYLRSANRVRGPPEMSELRDETIAKIEKLTYLFAHRMRLDEDFERYLMPRPTGPIPDILVDSGDPVDVNAIHFGIEYSFRFPEPPRSKEAAIQELRLSAEAFQAAMEAKLPRGARRGTIEQLDSTGHGHNLGVKFRYTAPNGDVWRIEWDGIRRTYDDEGAASRARAGHIEVPTPKKAPQDMEEVKLLYRAMRELGRVPSRHAGGAHLNVDLNPLFDLPARQGARKLANLIAFFESNREMVQFLWQHPFRLRSALPVELTPELVEALNGFSGGWDALGRLLYEHRYFNPYVTRKPAYAQVNATAVMGPAIPEEYNRTIDIRNETEEWFPAFGGKGHDRIEFRLFDAPPDEYMAALQVKYMRAFLNRALNTRGKIRLEPIYSPQHFASWKERPREFLLAAKAHLQSLGLDPQEFEPLLVDALRIQRAEPKPKPPLERFEDFLPPRE